MSIFNPELIKVNFKASGKEDCLRSIAKTFAAAGVIKEDQDFYEKLMERELVLSTGIGRGVAIPHLRDSSISELRAGIYLLDNEIDFDSLDRQKVKLILCMAVPEAAGKSYMKLLQKVSEFFRNETNRLMVYNCKDSDELLKIFRSIE